MRCLLVHYLQPVMFSVTGDDDIPYRERKKEKEARVRREVDKTRGEGGVELDVNGDMEMEGGVAPGPGKRKRGEDDVSDEAGEDGYYELVKQTKKEKKEEKKREYKEARMAERFVSSLGRGYSADMPLFQNRYYGRWSGRASFLDSGDSQEQGAHAAARKERAEPTRQEEGEVCSCHPQQTIFSIPLQIRKGEEEGAIAEGHV